MKNSLLSFSMALIAFLLFIPGCAPNASETAQEWQYSEEQEWQHSEENDSADTPKEKEEKPVLVNGTVEYFYSDHCLLCPEQKQVLSDWMSDKKGLTLEEISVDNEEAVTLGYDGKGVPFTRFVNEHGIVTSAGRGLLEQSELDEMATSLNEPMDEVVFTPDSNTYIDSNKAMSMDTSPFIQDNKVFVPVRYLAKSFGIEDEDILYADDVLTILSNGMPIQLIDEKPVIVMGEVVEEIDVAPVKKDDEIFLPAEYLIDIFGSAVIRDGNSIKLIKPAENMLKVNWPEPNPSFTQNGKEYYHIDMLFRHFGQPNFGYETEDVVLFPDRFHAGVVMEDGESRIFLIGSDEEYYKYTLQNELEYIDGKWYVTDDDMVSVGMLMELI